MEYSPQVEYISPMESINTRRPFFDKAIQLAGNFICSDGACAILTSISDPERYSRSRVDHYLKLADNSGSESDDGTQRTKSDYDTQVSKSDDDPEGSDSDDDTQGSESDDDPEESDSDDDTQGSESDDDSEESESDDDTQGSESDDDPEESESDDDTQGSRSDDDPEESESGDDIHKSEAEEYDYGITDVGTQTSETTNSSTTGSKASEDGTSDSGASEADTLDSKVSEDGTLDSEASEDSMRRRRLEFYMKRMKRMKRMFPSSCLENALEDSEESDTECSFAGAPRLPTSTSRYVHRVPVVAKSSDVTDLPPSTLAVGEKRTRPQRRFVPRPNVPSKWEEPCDLKLSTEEELPVGFRRIPLEVDETHASKKSSPLSTSSVIAAMTSTVAVSLAPRVAKIVASKAQKISGKLGSSIKDTSFSKWFRQSSSNLQHEFYRLLLKCHRPQPLGS